MNQTMKFSGAVCPSVIPLDDSGQIDLTGLEKHMARLSDSGINGILLSGHQGICHNERPRTGNAHPGSPENE